MTPMEVSSISSNDRPFLCLGLLALDIGLDLDVDKLKVNLSSWP